MLPYIGNAKVVKSLSLNGSPHGKRKALGCAADCVNISSLPMPLRRTNYLRGRKTQASTECFFIRRLPSCRAEGDK